MVCMRKAQTKVVLTVCQEEYKTAAGVLKGIWNQVVALPYVLLIIKCSKNIKKISKAVLWEPAEYNFFSMVSALHFAASLDMIPFKLQPQEL